MNDDRIGRVVNKTYNVLNEPVKIDEIMLVTRKEIKKAISTTKVKKSTGTEWHSEYCFKKCTQESTRNFDSYL